MRREILSLNSFPAWDEILLWKRLKFLRWKTYSKKNYLKIIAILLFHSFYTNMIFLFRKRERKDAELMNLSLLT